MAMPHLDAFSEAVTFYERVGHQSIPVERL